MTKLTLFHGSTAEIKKPIYGYGRQDNDFGLGFYCTESEQLSREWACQNNTRGISNKYTLDTESLRVLDLLDGRHSVMNWIALLIRYRNIRIRAYDADRIRKKIEDRFLMDIGPYDLIRGYRADDSYFLIANMFLGGIITYQQLGKALRLGNFGEQVVLKSERSFDRIEFISSSTVEPYEYYTAFRNRETAANMGLGDINLSEEESNSQFDVRVAMELDEDDPRLF